MTLTKHQRTTDFQKQRLYDWEGAFARSLGMHCYSAHPVLKDLQRVCLFVAMLLHETGLAARYNHFYVKSGTGTRWARGGYGFLNFPAWARNPFVVAHELAHGCGTVWHGPKFCMVYSELLSVSLKAAGITVTPGAIRSHMRKEGRLLVESPSASWRSQFKRIPKGKRTIAVKPEYGCQYGLRGYSLTVGTQGKPKAQRMAAKPKAK